MFVNPQPIKETKTWMVLGGADNFTLVKDCGLLGEKYKTNGADIEVTVKKGWHHGFTANYKEEYEGDNATFNNCPGAFTNDEGIIIYEGNSSHPDCIKYGTKIDGNKSAVFRKLFLKFFTKSLLN